MKQFGLVLVSLCALLGCQPQQEATPSDDKNNQLVVTDAASTVKPQTIAKIEVPKTPSIVVEEKYQLVEPQMACSEPVVIEFFAYHCPHCNHLEPSAQKWREKTAGKIKFVSIPWDLGNPQMAGPVIVHHAAKMLGIQEQVQHALFQRVHEEKKLFASPDEAIEFLVANGAEKQAARAALENQEAMSKSINADYELIAKYKISSVPQVLVNHRYLTSLGMAGGPDEVFQVVDDALLMDSACSAK